MGDADSGTSERLSGISFTFCCSRIRRRWEKTRHAVSQLKGLERAQWPIQKPEAPMNCANSVKEHLLPCCFDEEAVLHQL